MLPPGGLVDLIRKRLSGCLAREQADESDDPRKGRLLRSARFPLDTQSRAAYVDHDDMFRRPRSGLVLSDQI